MKRWTAEGWSSTWSGQTANGGVLGWANIDFNRYQITEVVPDGWYMSGPSAQAVEVNVDAYQLYAVTFGNLQPGTFVINKTWYAAGSLTGAPAGGAEVCLQRQGTAPVGASTLTPKDGSGQTLTLDATYGYCQPLTASATFTDLWPGSYTLQEKPLAGWTIPAPQTVLIDSGSNNAQTPVTLRNDRVLGALTVNKVRDFSKLPVEADLETIGAASASFGICIQGPSYLAPDCKTFDGSENPAWTQTWSDLIPGLYTVTETAAGNSWIATLPNNGQVEVSASQTATTYQVTNVYQPASLKVSKTVLWAGSNVDTQASFNICIQGPRVDGVFPEAKDCKSVELPGWRFDLVAAGAG
ncbi:MAG: collagen binding domain-containing protein [Bacteroidales bacterium]